MLDIKPGELVDITIRGGRVMAPKPGHDDLTIGYATAAGQPGVYATITLTMPSAESVVLTRVAPAEWPPQLGDLWRDTNNNLWFVSRYEDSDGRGEVRFNPGSDHAYGQRVYSADDLLSTHGPLTLVHREHRDQADADL